MGPSSKRSSSGAYLGLLVLVLVILPLTVVKFVGGALAPDLMDSVSQQVHGFVAGLSASVINGVKDAFLALILLAAAVYLSCLVHSLMRGEKSGERSPRSRRAA